MLVKNLGQVLSAAICLSLALPAAGQVLNTPSEGDAPAASTPSTDPTFAQITRIYENWSLQCQERSGEGGCYVETVIRQNEPQVRDVVVLRFSQSEGGLVATIVTPNRVKLDKGVTLSVGETALAAPYVICGPVNCNASFPPQEGLAELLLAQSEIAVSFYVFAPESEGGEREIRIPISLAGFKTASEHLVVFDAEQ